MAAASGSSFTRRTMTRRTQGCSASIRRPSCSADQSSLDTLATHTGATFHTEHARTRTRTLSRTQSRTQSRTRAHAHTRTQTRARMHTDALTHARLHAHTHAHARTCTPSCTHRHRHTHAHTHELAWLVLVGWMDILRKSIITRPSTRRASWSLPK